MTVAAKQLEHERAFVAPDENRRHELGQFLTPHPVADFMASLFEARWQEENLLDAGGGNGALSAALVRRLCVSHPKPKRVSITACELDEAMIESLRATLRDCEQECAAAGRATPDRGRAGPVASGGGRAEAPASRDRHRVGRRAPRLLDRAFKGEL